MSRCGAGSSQRGVRVVAGLSEAFWTGLQDDYERDLVKERIGDTLEAIRPIAS